jgi:C-terminal processing protease CtpA/Prc
MLPSPDALLETLRAGLKSEREAREALAREVAELRARSESSTVVAPARTGVGSPPTLETLASKPKAANAQSEVRPVTRAAESEAGSERRPAFDEDALVNAGINRIDATRLRERWEKLMLEKLELHDRAMRESYFMTPQHGAESTALDLAFRSEVGEADYNAYLYATSQDNAVVVRDVLSNATARATGLEIGDQIVRYGGSTILTISELQIQTMSGVRGESVEVDALRDGRMISLRAPRGPLGVVTEAARRPPSSR